MIVFNYFINFLEGLILSSFVAYYFNIKNKKRYICLVTLLCFLEISISNYFDTFDETLVFLVIITSFIFLWKEKENTWFEKIFICSLSEIFLLFGNLLSILVTTIMFDITTVQIYTKDIYYIFVVLFSKTIYIIFSFMCCYLKRKYKYYLTLQNGWIILFLSLTIIYVIGAVMETLLIGTFTSQDAISLTLALIVICILFLIIFRQSQIDNEKKLRYELEIQKHHFSQENYSKMKMMSNQMTELEHRMTYVLMQVKNCIEQEDSDSAKMIIDQYVKKVEKFSAVINTGNPYFDFIMSRRINEYGLEDIHMKNTIIISEDERFNDKKFCDLILLCLNLLKSHISDEQVLNLSICQQNQFIIIEMMGRIQVESLELTDEIYNLINLLDVNYSIDVIESIVSLKMILE